MSKTNGQTGGKDTGLLNDDVTHNIEQDLQVVTFITMKKSYHFQWIYFLHDCVARFCIPNGILVWGNLCFSSPYVVF